MNNAVIIINSWIVVITWCCDAEQSNKAFTNYFHPNGKQISTWTEIQSAVTRLKITDAVDLFCEEHNLINYSN